MSSSTKSETGGTGTRDRYITDAIESKRKTLDEEIVAFKAVKDQEFRAFEAYLRRYPGEPTVASAEAHVESLGLRYKIKKPKSHKGVNQPGTTNPRRRTDESIVRNGHVGFIGEGTLGPEEEAARMRLEARRIAEVRKEEHEREREFQGVITPSYLPLLGGRRHAVGKENKGPSHLSEQLSSKEKEKKTGVTGEKKNTKASKQAMERQQMKTEIAKARRGPTPGLSSSAEDFPPAMTSPPAAPSRPISSSVPQEHDRALKQRRSSSRSDLSIDGLRSSLKDPSQPKSPKRVQFSIDNTVVSPSTSPLARRPSAETPAAAAAKGVEKFEVVKGKREGKSSANGPIGDGAGSSSSGPSPNSSITGMSSFSGYFQSKREEAGASTATGADEFDILDNEDDLFSFDEDISSRNSGKARETSDGEMIAADIEEEVGNGPQLTGSSPHAGSLPIEIKLPARRGREADDG